VKRLLAALLFAATMAGGLAAYANSLSVAANSLGAAGVTVPKCSSASWTLTPQYSADTTTVTGVIVNNIATECLVAGDTLTVVGSTASQTATGSMTLSALTVQPVTVPFSGAPSSLPTLAVTNLAASVVGP
jgi:hypothetical protein